MTLKISVHRHFSLAASSAPLLIIRSLSVLIQLLGRKALCTAQQKNPFHCITGIHLPFAFAQNNIPINVPVLPASSYNRSCLTSVIQKLSVPHARVTSLFTKLDLLCKQNSPVSFSRYTSFYLR